MIMVRIVSDGLAFSGSEIEAARIAATESLRSEGIDSPQLIVAARNRYITSLVWAEANPDEPAPAGPWDRAMAAAAEALNLEPAETIDLVPRA